MRDSIKKALVALGAVAVVAAALVLVPGGGEPAQAGVVNRMVVNTTDEVVYVGRKLAPGGPIAVAKPPYPEECGLGVVGQSVLPNPPPADQEYPNLGPFSAFCDVVPLTVQVPSNVKPSDDVRLTLRLFWPQQLPNGTMLVNCTDNPPPPGEQCTPNPSSNLDLWLWDDKQALAAKKPIPEFDGQNTAWTPAEVFTQYTLLRAGTGEKRPAKIVVNDAKSDTFNIVILNSNAHPFDSAQSVNPAVPGCSQRVGPVTVGQGCIATQAQPSGPCVAPNGVPGCYVLKAKLDVISDDLPSEKGEPEQAVTRFIPRVPTTLPEILPEADASDVIGPPLPNLTPVDFGATVLPPPQASNDDVSVLGAVESSVDPLLESIKASSLEDELAAPELQTAVSEEPPPVPPSGALVAVSMAALPVLALGATALFLIRRRRAFRLS